MATFELVIEYDDFIARQELNYVLEAIDYIIEETLFPERLPENRTGGRSRRASTSYIAISGVRDGSIELLVTVGAAVGVYLGRRLRRGFNRGTFPEQVERVGQVVSDGLGGIVERFNDWAERYVQTARERGSNIRVIRAQASQRQLGEGE